MRDNGWDDRPGRERAAAKEPNAALREIAGRIKNLSYRNMMVLAEAIYTALPSSTGPHSAEYVAAILLDTCDNLENA